MKKNKIGSNKECLPCQKVIENLKQTKAKIETKIKEGQIYVKKNPEKSKTILAGLGAFLIVLISFFIGRKTKNNKNKK